MYNGFKTTPALLNSFYSGTTGVSGISNAGYAGFSMPSSNPLLWDSSAYTSLGTNYAETMPSGAGGAGFMGNLSIGSSIGGAIGSMFSAFISADATSYVLKKQAEILKINEGKQQMNVESALRAGESQVAKVTAQAGAVKAKQRAAMAANGVQIGVGSSAELLTTTDINKKQDVKAIQENALSAAWGYATKASEANTMSQISMLGSQYQKDTQISQTIGAGLESIGKVADKWYSIYGRQ